MRRGSRQRVVPGCAGAGIRLPGKGFPPSPTAERSGMEIAPVNSGAGQEEEGGERPCTRTKPSGRGRGPEAGSGGRQKRSRRCGGETERLAKARAGKGCAGLGGQKKALGTPQAS